MPTGRIPAMSSPQQRRSGSAQYEAVRAYALRFPESHEDVPWGHSAIKVRIDDEILDETFDPFFEGSPDAPTSGGLGLPICYRIVAEHGGQLHVQSRPNVGTWVCVQLPEAPSA